MKVLTFSGACAQIANLPADRAGLARADLAAAMQAGAALEAGGFTVFDPLECTASDRSWCAYHGRPLIHEQRICLAALDAAVRCPGTER